MRLTKNELIVNPTEAALLGSRLRGNPIPSFIPHDQDSPADAPDLFLGAASFLENGGAVRVKARAGVPVQGLEPPVETEHDPPHTFEPQAGNPMEPGRKKVLAEHPDAEEDDATEEGDLTEDDLGEHPNRDSSGKTAKAGRGDSDEHGGKGTQEGRASADQRPGGGRKPGGSVSAQEQDEEEVDEGDSPLEGSKKAKK